MPTAEIKEFKGIKDISFVSDGALLGYAEDMRNFRITAEYRLKKREGIRYIGRGKFCEGAVVGMFYGALVNNPVPLIYIACDGQLISLNPETEEIKRHFYINRKAENVHMFTHNRHLYILDGEEYYRFDGIAHTKVSGYVPTVLSEASPSGEGTHLEEFNALNGDFICTYVGDGTEQNYHLAAKNIGGVKSVNVDGVERADYTVNHGLGVVHFETAPVMNASVRITAYLDGDQRKNITACQRGMMFSGQNDMSLFLWGDPTNPYHRYYSGVGDVEYFPVSSYTKVGAGEYPITDIVRQYDRQIIFTNGGIFYSLPDLTDPLNIYYPVYTVNSEVGNTAPGMVQIVDNDPWFIDKEVYRLKSSNVRDERNAVSVSDNISKFLAKEDMKGAVCYDYSEKGEYLLSLDGGLYIINYKNGTSYIFSPISASRFISVNGVLYFGSRDGGLYCFDEELCCDILSDGKKRAIEAYALFPWYAPDGNDIYKSSQRICSLALPYGNTEFTVTSETDKGDCNVSVFKIREFDFKYISFSDFTFDGKGVPRLFADRIYARCYRSIKFSLFSNGVDSTAEVVSVSAPYNKNGNTTFG